MAFLNFLSKKKQEPEELLDLPPLPPSGKEDDLALAPAGDEIPPPPELPPFPSPIEKEELPSLPKKGLPKGPQSLPKPGFLKGPAMPHLEEELPPLPKELPEELPLMEGELPPLPKELPEELPPLAKVGLPQEPIIPHLGEGLPPLPKELPPLPKQGLPKGPPSLPKPGFLKGPAMPHLEEELPPMPKELPEELPPLAEAGLPQEPIIPHLGEGLPPMSNEMPEELPHLEEEFPETRGPHFVPTKPRIIPGAAPPIPGPAIEEPETPALKKHIFIRVADFKTVLREINQLKGNLTASDEALSKLTNLEEEKNKMYTKWHENLEFIQKKLISVERVLAKGG